MTKRVCPRCGEETVISKTPESETMSCVYCGASLASDMSAEPLARQAVRFSVMSLILAVLSPVIFLVLGAISNYWTSSIVAGAPALLLAVTAIVLALRTKAWEPAGKAIRFGAFSILLLFLLLGVVLPVFFQIALAPQKMAYCANNLKFMWMVCQMYAGDHDGYYPPMSSELGNLAPDEKSIFPEYMDTLTCYECPSTREISGRYQFADADFLYTGYIMRDRGDVALFCDEYRRHFAQGGGEWHDMMSLHNSTRVVYRTRKGLERNFITQISTSSITEWASVIPVIIERPGNHKPLGGNVVFLDGHVEFMKYPSEFPMIPEVIEPLLALADEEPERGP